MLDIRFVREHLDEVATAMENRNHSWDSEYFKELDESRRSLICQEEELLNQRNVLSKSIGKLMGEGKKDEAQAYLTRYSFDFIYSTLRCWEEMEGQLWHKFGRGF